MSKLPPGREGTDADLYHLLVQNVQDYAVFALDAEGRVLTWSAPAEHLLGYREEEVVGQPADRFYPPEDVARGVPGQELRQALAAGRVEEDRWYVRKDGSRFWSGGVTTPLRREDGSLRGFAKLMRDRTDLKQAADARNDALAYAQAIVETVREPLVVLDGGLRVRSANHAFYKTFAVSPQETEGRLLYDLGNRQWDIPRLRTLLEEVLPQSKAFNDFEVTHDFPDIGRKVMLLNGRTLRREGTEIDLILLAIEDVTARRRAEEERREIETRFTALVKNIKDHSIFTLDPEGQVTSWNVAAEHILGYTEAEVLGRHFAFIFTPEDREQGLPETELRAAREHGRAEDERWHLRKGGERFWALGIVSAVRDAEDRLTGFSKILRDMTARKHLEDELRRSRDELERRVEERTAELRASQQRALQVERLATIGETVTTVAHEGRNAVQRATACLDRLDWRLEDRPEALDLARRARQALDDVIHLFDDMRAYAAPIQLQVGACDLRALWRERWDQLIGRHPGRDARLEEHDSGMPVVCQADPFRLTQVFTNLFTNALEACPDPVHVTVACGQVVLDGRAAVRLTIEDNGPGFTAEQRQRALEPFYTTKPTGTGLGLAIVRRIMEAHGGTIAIEAAERGARIVLSLPCRPAEAVA